MRSSHKSENVNRSTWARLPMKGSVAFGLCTLALCGLAYADDLRGDLLRGIVEGQIWTAEDGWGYWEWQADNELCVRTYSPDEECTDRGPWTIKDDALCYELEWWSEAYGLRKNCFVVRALGESRYEAIPKDSPVASAVFSFSLME